MSGLSRRARSWTPLLVLGPWLFAATWWLNETMSFQWEPSISSAFEASFLLWVPSEIYLTAIGALSGWFTFRRHQRSGRLMELRLTLLRPPELATLLLQPTLLVWSIGLLASPLVLALLAPSSFSWAEMLVVGLVIASGVLSLWLGAWSGLTWATDLARSPHLVPRLFGFLSLRFFLGLSVAGVVIAAVIAVSEGTPWGARQWNGLFIGSMLTGLAVHTGLMLLLLGLTRAHFANRMLPGLSDEGD